MKSIITDKQPIDSIKKCIICGTPLTGLQTKYCSTKCKVKDHSSYPAQQKRGYERKRKLVNLLGGKCSRCGYSKCLAALEFHHTDPENKSFQLDLRSLSNRSFKVCKEESHKCILLCANCHRELHNTDNTIH